MVDYVLKLRVSFQSIIINELFAVFLPRLVLSRVPKSAACTKSSYFLQQLTTVHATQFEPAWWDKILLRTVTELMSTNKTGGTRR